MNKEILRAAFSLLGSRTANYSWQTRYMKYLLDTQRNRFHGIADECIAKGWRNIAIWRDNAFSRACASCLAENSDLTVVIFDKKKPLDFEALDADYLFQAVSAQNEIGEEFDILFYSDYTDYLRARGLLDRRIRKGNRIWDGLHHLIYDAWCGQIGAYVREECEKMQKLQGEGYKLLHLSIPSYEEICTDHSKKIYSTNITAKSLDTLRLLFGYMKEEDFKIACKEFLRQGSWVKKGNLVTVDDYESTYFNRINGERHNYYTRTDTEHTMWLIGPCIVLGSYVEDKYTLASLLQKRINADMNVSFRVRAYATLPYVSSIRNMLCWLSVKKGDIVVIVTDGSSLSQLNPGL